MPTKESKPPGERPEHEWFPRLMGALKRKRRTEESPLDKMRQNGIRLMDAWAELPIKERLREIDRKRTQAGIVRIFVGNNATAFFNVEGEEETKLSSLGTTKVKRVYGEYYNEKVPGGKTKYYATDGIRSPFITTSVTSPCIVFLAYTMDERGAVTRAGVFHYYTNREGLAQMIHEVSNGEHVYLKAAGDDNLTKKGLESRERKIREELAQIDCDVTLVETDLGRPGYRVIETYPLRGQIRTYWRKGKPPIKRI